MKLERKPVIFVTATLILAALIMMVFLNLKPKSKPIELLPLVREEDLTGQDLPQLKGVEVSLFDQANRLNWRLNVENLIEEAGFYQLFGIRGTYHTTQGDYYLIQAPTGKVGKEFDWLQLAPEVMITGQDLDLQAEEINWDTRSGEEITGKKLVMKRKDFTVQAAEFRFKPEEGGLVVPGASRWSFN